MKIKYREALELLQNLINFKPTHTDISKILNCAGISVTPNALANRLANDGYLKDVEVAALEESYAIKLENSKDYIEADYYPDVFGSCGGGSFLCSENKEKICIPKNAFWNYSKNEKYSVINAMGDSMSPLINDKDKLVVKQWGGEQISDNRIYIFCYDDKIFIKRLVYNINELVIKSENAQYSTIILQKNELEKFFIIGQIVGLFRDLR